MKKILIVFLMMLMFVSPVIGSSTEQEEIPPAKIEAMQLTADILASCILDTAKPYVIIGFSTEMSVYFGIKNCVREGENLEMEMTDAGLTAEEQLANFENLFKGMVAAIDTARNNDAAKRLKEFAEKKKNETSL